MTDAPNTSHDNMANALFTALTNDASFTLPTLDLDSTDFDFPTTAYTDNTRLTESDLTTRTVGGSGLFDGLMASIAAQLNSEFEAGRITAKEYSTSYVALSQSAMSSAVQYLLQKDQQFWQAELIKQQARAAELGVVQAKLQVEQLKAQVLQTRMAANSVAAEYSLNKMRLATEEANIDLVDAQKDLAASQKSQVDYQVSNVLPAEVSRTNKQVEVDTAQIARLTSQNTVDVANVNLVTSQKTQVDYQTNTVLPQEVALSQKRVDVATADISLTTANVSKANYETQSLLPSQKAKIDKDAAMVDYQTTALLVSQKLNVDEDTAVKQYQKDHLMPAQKNNFEEQTEAHRAKTSNTRSDGTTAVEGSMGKQKDLHDEQITAYKRDAEAKAVKMILDTWITRMTVDSGTSLPTDLNTTALETILSEMKTNLGFTP